MRGLVIVIGACILLSGCATQRTIQLDPPDQAALTVISNEVGNGRATLELDTGSVPEVFDLSLGVDSLRWRTRDGGRHVIDPAQIRSIEIRDRGRGVLEGVLVGIGVAALAGTVTAICCEATSGVVIPPEYVVGVGVGIVVIPLGALIGAVRGHPVVFQPR